MEPDPDALAARLRDLASVDVEALVAGATPARAAALRAAHGAELDDAIAAGRALSGDLARRLAVDPLRWLDASGALRAEQAPLAVATAATALATRAHQAEAFARLTRALAPAVATRVAMARRGDA